MKKKTISDIENQNNNFINKNEASLGNFIILNIFCGVNWQNKHKKQFLH